MILAVEITAAIGVGAIIGYRSELDPQASPPRYRIRLPELLIWIGFIALRVMIARVMAALGLSSMLAASSAIMFTLAALKAAQILIVHHRLRRPGGEYA